MSILRGADAQKNFADADWYDTPRLYDVIFREGTEQEAKFLEAMVLRHGLHTKRQTILEPACGSGRLVEAMARRGHHVCGFDLNAKMVAYTAKRVEMTGLTPHVALWVADMAKFSTSRKFSLVHTLVSTFKYLADDASALLFLTKVAASLLPGGLFILGLHLTQYTRARRTVERWFGREDDLEVICKIDSWPASRVTRTEAMRSRLTAIVKGAKERLETHWRFRTYDVGEMKDLLAQVPSLELVACHDFHHDPSRSRALDASQSDLVLVLRRIRETEESGLK